MNTENNNNINNTNNANSNSSNFIIMSTPVSVQAPTQSNTLLSAANPASLIPVQTQQIVQPQQQQQHIISQYQNVAGISNTIVINQPSIPQQQSTQQNPQIQQIVHNQLNSPALNSVDQQTFHSWIELLTDQNSSDEVKLKAIQDLSFNLEVLF